MKTKKKRAGKKKSGRGTTGTVAGAGGKFGNAWPSFPFAVSAITSVAVSCVRLDGTAEEVFFFVPRVTKGSRAKSRRST